jgi:hypothetical protein
MLFVVLIIHHIFSKSCRCLLDHTTSIARVLSDMNVQTAFFLKVSQNQHAWIGKDFLARQNSLCPTPRLHPKSVKLEKQVSVSLLYPVTEYKAQLTKIAVSWLWILRNANCGLIWRDLVLMKLVMSKFDKCFVWNRWTWAKQQQHRASSDGLVTFSTRS